MKKINMAGRFIRSYKRRSIAIILSLILSVGLVVGTGILKATNDNIELLKMKDEDSPYQVGFKKVDNEQIKNIEKNKNIKHLGLMYIYNYTSEEERQDLRIVGANDDYILSNAKIIEGRLPREKNEMVAERWVLRNLGLKEEIDQKIILSVKDGQGGSKKEKFYLTGIISDIASSKSVSLMELFIPFNINSGKQVILSASFKKGTDVYSEINRIIREEAIPRTNVYPVDDLISLETSNGKTTLRDLEILIFMTLVCGIVIYGIYNISTYKRIHEYGMLRAVGYDNFKIFKLIFQELFNLYIISVPVGIILGIAGAMGLSQRAGDINATVILHGKTVKMGMVFPLSIILGCIVSIGIIMILISYLTYRQVKKVSIIDAIKGNLNDESVKESFITIKKLRKYMKTYKAISFKNMLRNKKSFLMIVLSMSICGILFITLSYKLSLDKSSDDIRFKEYFMNSDFTMDECDDSTVVTGISEKTIKRLKKMPEIKSLETSMVMPSRMVIDKKDRINLNFYKRINSAVSNTYVEAFLDKDKITGELILKNNIKGYNDAALEKLKNYLKEGNIDINKMKKGKIAVLYIPRVIKDGKPLFNGKGEKVINIKPGDKIKIKFKEDKVLDDNYWIMKDTGANYVYEEFTVGAIVYYPYMAETSIVGLDTSEVIISEEEFRKITGINAYTSANINVDRTADQDKLEKKISDITSKDRGVILRNITKEKENIQSMRKKTQINNMGIISILFIITISNIINNIGYNILSRTNEFGMLRAIGLNDEDFKKMIIFEGLLYGIISSIIVLVSSLIIQMIIYDKSNISSIGIDFKIRYIDYITVITLNLILGAVTTYFQSKKFRGSSIIECMNKVE